MLGLIGSISVLEFDFSYIQIVACLSFACVDIHHTYCPWNSLLRSLAQCWEDPETEIKQWPWIFQNQSMNGGCWILELQSTLVAWISKHTVKRTKRELELQT